MHRRHLIRSAGLLILAACSRQVEQPPATTPVPTADPAPSPAPTGTAVPTPRGTPPPTAEPSPQPTPAPTPAPAPDPAPEPSATTAPAPDPAPEPSATTAPAPQAGPVPLEQVCRTSLGLPEAKPDARTHTIAGLMLHHTAVASSAASQAPGRLRAHANYHRDQGWPDIAYHVGVDLDGNVYELRDTSTPGDTFTEYDPNGWFLLVAEGDFNTTTPTPALLEAASRVFAWAAGTFGVPTATLAGHRDAASTTCPGSQLYGALPSIRDRAQQILDAGGVSWRSVCGAEGEERVRRIEAG